MTDILENAVAVSEESKDIYTQWLGVLTSSSLSRFTVSHEALETYYEENEVDRSLKMKSLTYSNRFYQATDATGERFKSQIKLPTGDVLNYRVVRVGSEKHVMRLLVRDGTKMEPVMIGGWRKTGNGQTCRTRSYNGNEPCPSDCKEHMDYAVESFSQSVEYNSEWEGINDAMKEEMEFLEGNFTDRHFRELYERQLRSWKSIKYTSGLRFVPQDHAEEVEQLISLFQWLEDNSEKRTFSQRKTQGVKIVSIPLVNDLKRREMVEQSYELETTEILDEMLEEYKEMKAKKEKVGTKKLNSWLKKYEEAQKSKEHYEKILQMKMSKSDSALKTLNAVLANLMKSKGVTESFSEPVVVEEEEEPTEGLEKAIEDLDEAIKEKQAPPENDEDDIFGDLDDFLGL